MPISYHFCSECNHEFMSDEAFFGPGHKCMHKNDGSDKVLSRMGAPKELKDMDPEVRKSVLESMGAEGAAIEAKLNSEEKAKKPAPTGGDDKTVPAEQLSARLDASKEIVLMKGELQKHGIDAQTLTPEETRAEYEKVMAAKAATKKKTTKKQ